MPTKTQLVWEALGLSGDVTDARWDALQCPPTAGKTINKLAPLFPKERVER